MLLVGFLIGSAALLTPGGLAEHEAWLAVLISIGPSVGLALLYAWLAQRFPRQTMVEMARTVYGPIIGTIVAGLYVIYVFHLGSLIVTNYGDFFVTMVFTKTPEWAILVVFTALAAYAVWSGIEPLARTAALLVGPVLAVILLNSVVIAVNHIEVKNLLPLFETPLPKLLWAAWTALAFPFAEIVVFLMITPSLHRPREGRRWIVSSVIAIGLLFVMLTARNAASLGRSLTTFPYASFAALRMVNIGDFLTRFEVSIAGVFIITGFCKLSVLYYGSTVGFAQLLGLKDRRSLIVPLGVLLVLLGIHNFGSLVENADFATMIYPIWGGIFQIIIPVTTAIVAKVRHLPRTIVDSGENTSDSSPSGQNGAGQSADGTGASQRRPQPGGNQGNGSADEQVAGQVDGSADPKGAGQTDRPAKVKVADQEQVANPQGVVNQQPQQRGQKQPYETGPGDLASNAAADPRTGDEPQ